MNKMNSMNKMNKTTPILWQNVMTKSKMTLMVYSKTSLILTLISDLSNEQNEQYEQDEQDNANFMAERDDQIKDDLTGLFKNFLLTQISNSLFLQHLYLRNYYD